MQTGEIIGEFGINTMDSGLCFFGSFGLVFLDLLGSFFWIFWAQLLVLEPTARPTLCNYAYIRVYFRFGYQLGYK